MCGGEAIEASLHSTRAQGTQPGSTYSTSKMSGACVCYRERGWRPWQLVCKISSETVIYRLL